MDQLLDYILHFDAYLTQAVEALGLWAYAAIFATIFCETGLVVAPFLPGESLLLASGTLAGAGVLEILVLWPLLVGAAFLGDVVNYLIGRWIGRHLLSKPRKHLRPEHMQQAHEFYEEHGGLAIVALPVPADRAHPGALRRRHDAAWSSTATWRSPPWRPPSG